MKHQILSVLLLLLMTISCEKKNNDTLISKQKLYAWCIVPFDSVKRSPTERIEMLKRLELEKYAYDWREENLATMAEELRLAKKNDIEVIAVWMWINSKRDSLGHLSHLNVKVFDAIKKAAYQGQIWVGFNANFFENLSNEEAINKGAEMISFLNEKAKNLGCTIALYNHGDWFGEPKNQVSILKALPEENLGLVYNFHHGHEQIDDFPTIVDTMLPYLWNVNINGMRKEGPKILTIGEGDYEKEMIALLLGKGYKGDFGILGHVDEEDVEKILKANLNGLKSLELKY